MNSVTSDGTPTMEARRRLLGAGSLYVAAVLALFVLFLAVVSRLPCF